MKLEKMIQWLEKQEACPDGIEWVRKCGTGDPVRLIRTAIKSGKIEQLEWCNWGIVRLLTKRERVMYAVYAAQQCLHLFEKKYPGDDRARTAIEAARRYTKRQTRANVSAAWSAGSAAGSAARSAGSADWSAWSAAGSAMSAAWSAAETVGSAARSAGSAAWSAGSAAMSAAWSAESARSAWSAAYKNILKYGIKLLKSREKD